MINLSSDNYQKKIRREYFWRYLSGWCWVLSFALVVLAVVFLIFGLNFSYQKQSFVSSPNDDRYRASAQFFDELSASVNKTTARIQILNNIASQDHRLVSKVFGQILRARVRGIHYSFISFGRASNGEVVVQIKGYASERRVLLDYLNFLKNDKNFTRVDSKLVDLIKENHNEFELDLVVAVNNLTLAP